MDPITILSAALGFLFQGAAQSKTAEKAKNELLDGFWQWIRPLFLEDVPEVAENPDAPEVQEQAGKKLLALAQDEQFFQELAQRVAKLQQAGVRQKNVVESDITRVKKIRIGDKEYNPNDRYDMKNIFKGNVSDADEFILGDGH
ncbi:MAG: hypothetical protein JNJ57_12535 [Saprospiraceae bacterium]|nr:hypothetical protein [Saprospiraceae bacterium]